MILRGEKINLTLIIFSLILLFSFQSFSQGTWTKKADFGGPARYGAVGFSIGDFGYLGTGGDRRNDFWQYNPATDTWTEKANFGGSERLYAVGFAIGNKGYIATGDEGTAHGNMNGGATNDIYEYDPDANTWTKKADFPGTPRFGSVGFSIGSKGYIGTGHLNPNLGDPNFRVNDFWEFDPNAGSLGTWTEKNKIGVPSADPKYRRAYATGFSIGSKGYIGTGNTQTGKVKDFWEYDPATDFWTQKADFGGYTRFSAVGLSIGSLGYIGTGDVGSQLPEGYATDFWEYNPGSNLWTQKTDIPGEKKSSSAAFSIGGKGYFGTGNNSSYIKLKLFYEYTPACVPPVAPVIGTITQPSCGIPTGSVQLSGLPSGTWTVTLNYPSVIKQTGTGATTTFPNLTAGTSTTTYTVTVTDASGCTSAPSAPFTINVNPNSTTLGAIIGPKSVCSGSTGVTYSIAAVSGFTNYSWSVPGPGWVITAGQGTTNVTVKIGTEVGSVSVSATNGCPVTATSTTGIITPDASKPATPSSISGPPNLCAEIIQNYSIPTVSGATSYTWSVSNSSWYIYTGQGTTNTAIVFTAATDDLSVKANNGCGSSLTSVLNITANPVPKINIQPVSNAVNYGSSASFTVVATGYSISYKWQEKIGANTFIDITNGGIYSGATTSTLNLSLPTVGMSGNKYRCIITGLCNPSVTSDGNSALTVTQLWSGTTSTDWNINTNWNSNIVPDASTNVTIPNTTNKPVIDIAASCNNLTINTGAVLTINAGKSLTVNGTLTNNAVNGGLVLKSDASGTGSLINSTINVPATLERYVKGDWANVNSGWHFLSSPVSNLSISNFTTTGDLNGYDFYGWNEATNQWINYKNAGFSTWNGGNTYFTVGRGYMVSYQQNQTKTFTGNINVGNVTMSNLSKSIGANYSWHLLGNPFSSALKWNDGSNWALTNVAGTAKIWNGGEKSYNDIAPNGIIPSAQGFMVSVDLSNNSITIPAASRTHNNNNWLKSKEEPGFLLLASEQDGNSAQESKVLIDPASTTGFDFEYDSRFLPGYAPQFYSVSDNEMLSTNSLPSLLNDEVIPFGFVKNQADSFKIELKEGIAGQVVYLTDLKTNTIQNLIDNPVYSFTSAEGDDPERFHLSFSNFTSVIEPQRSGTFDLYQNNGHITILTAQSVDAQIVISNMLGQVVMRGTTNGNRSSTLNTSKLQNGVYVVNLTGNNVMKSKKIVVSR